MRGRGTNVTTTVTELSVMVTVVVVVNCGPHEVDCDQVEHRIYLYAFTHLIKLGQSCFPAFVYVQLLVRNMDSACFNSIFAKSILCIPSPVWKTVLLYVFFVPLKQHHFQHCLSLFLSPLSFTLHHNSFFSTHHFSSSASSTSISYCVFCGFLPSISTESFPPNMSIPTCVRVQCYNASSFAPIFQCWLTQLTSSSFVCVCMCLKREAYEIILVELKGSLM